MSSLQTFTLVPRNFGEAMELAKVMASSDLVPKDYKGKPGNVLVASAMGSELGLSPMQALQNISVINGRPAVWGDAMLALCQSHRSTEDVCEMNSDDVKTLQAAIARAHDEKRQLKVSELQIACIDAAETLEPPFAVCGVKRRGRPTPVIRTFAWADAVRAGLANKEGPWRQYPQRMLQMRARAFALRDGYADVLRGISCAEEVQDYAVVDANSSTTHEPPASMLTPMLTPMQSLPPAPAVTHDVSELRGRIDGCASAEELEALLPELAHAPDEAKDELRAAYKSRMTACRAAAAPKGGDDRPWEKYSNMSGNGK